jgi:hypothetical protein
MKIETQLEEAVCFAALNVADAIQRKLFLDRACAGDERMRAAVERMLADHTDAEQFFSKGRASLSFPDDVKAALSTNGAEQKIEMNLPDDEQIGKRVGRYRLLQKIGEGGCGVVYMAEQEEPVRRRVAVKVIKLGMDTKSVIARFEAERQALALMDHPNIARVLDAGATEAGRPFFVMELVRGTRITEYCDQNNLDTRQRLDLFMQICRAIQHAHQKGIIHRDIKPSNILVTLHDGVPVPKVIDFGIAKATEGRLTDNTLFTAYEQFVGTPAYMSPEQAEMSGLDIDTRSDIYSLGVLLYELLTSKTPFDGKTMMQLGLDEMRRTLREKEPQSPSAMITTLRRTELTATASHRHAEPPNLISLLKGDLDWIVMKALEKDRTRRYETANGLAMDIQRYLDSEPVIARPPSRRYRFQKLVRRNKGVFVASGAVAIALILGLGLSTWLFFREREARNQQAHLREEAEAREKITQAAVFVSQEKFEEADKLLDEVKTPPPKPSFDGVSAYRSVGEWLALQGRWTEAAGKYSALMEIDKLDKWNAVTLDYQACGVVLMESGGFDRYRRFCESTVDKFAGTTNWDAAGRILKTCLLLPPDKDLMKQMQPFGDAAEKLLASLDSKGFPGWAAIPASLWRYRLGDYERATNWCHYGLNENDKTSARDASLRLILAMSDYQTGETGEARSQLALARESIDSKFQSGLAQGNSSDGYWYDWAFAQILLREANTLITEPSGFSN